MDAISIAPEALFTLNIGSFEVPITNAMILGVASSIFLAIWLIRMANRLKKEEESGEPKKRSFLTRLVIWCFEGLNNSVHTIIPIKKVADAVAPFTISIFFIVAIHYYTGILPFVGEAITLNHLPLLRSQASDLNFTFMLAILTIVIVQVWAVRVLGVGGNLKRYLINPIKDPIGSFSGFLEIIAEFSRIISLSMRLFGNVFAGEVLLVVVTSLTSYASPLLLPFFYIFELFIGGIQAYVFFMLATVFIGLAVTHAHHEKEKQSAKSSKSSHSKSSGKLVKASEAS